LHKYVFGEVGDLMPLFVFNWNLIFMEEQQYIGLIIKQISNDITAEELKLLDDWLRVSAENRRIAATYQQAWNLVPMYGIPLQQPDLDASYGRLMQRIQSQPVSRMKVWSRFAARAAAAVLVIGVLGYYQVIGPEEKMLIAAAGNVEKKEVILPDGSRVWLRQGSSLSYPVAFAGNTRCVQLEGEAFFEVTYDPNHHFCVELPQKEKIEVLGTSFNIKPSDQAIVVAVQSGKVRFKPDPSKTKEAFITAGNRGVYQVSTAQLNVAVAPTANDFAWQKGGLEFERTPLKQVIEDMQSYFGVEIIIEDQAILNCTYSTNMLKGNIDDVLEVFRSAFKMHLINPSPKKYIFKGGTCL
jgi:ferric-dicitrate binding protein FerR (iron transport regulator)